MGKAKSLRKRVGSYFNKIEGVNRKTLRLVSEIEKIEYTVSGTEFDALLLENNLIKQNQPKYNILLKDDKTFPYICILKSPFHASFTREKYIPEQGRYFGPYSSVVAMKNILELARKLYTIRTCHLLLTPNNIEQKKFKSLPGVSHWQLQRPCEGLPERDWLLTRYWSTAVNLKGPGKHCWKKYFSGQMNAAASTMQFEKAQFFKEKLDYLERFQTKSLVVNPRHHRCRRNHIDQQQRIQLHELHGDPRRRYDYLLQVNGAKKKRWNRWRAYKPCFYWKCRDNPKRK